MLVNDVFTKLRDLKTLLIDDDELVCDSLGRVFKAKGCYLMAVETAEKGLQAIEQETFDVIISDYRLPGINGMELFKRISSTHPNTVNLLITAYGDKEIVSKALNTRVHNIIEKPFSPETIMDTLAPLLEKSTENG
jgi:two-component system response regulator HydG